jgi:hypothetical protein
VRSENEQGQSQGEGIPSPLSARNDDGRALPDMYTHVSSYGKTSVLGDAGHTVRTPPGNSP